MWDKYSLFTDGPYTVGYCSTEDQFLFISAALVMRQFNIFSRQQEAHRCTDSIRLT